MHQAGKKRLTVVDDVASIRAFGSISRRYSIWLCFRSTRPLIITVLCQSRSDWNTSRQKIKEMYIFKRLVSRNFERCECPAVLVELSLAAVFLLRPGSFIDVQKILPCYTRRVGVMITSVSVISVVHRPSSDAQSYFSANTSIAYKLNVSYVITDNVYASQ